MQFLGCQDGVNRVPIGLNLLKYCSAFPPIWLAASVGLGYHHDQLLIVTETAATINSLYSYAVS